MNRAPLLTLVALSAVLVAVVAAIANFQSANSQTPSPAPQSVALPAALGETEIRVHVLARGFKFIAVDIGFELAEIRVGQRLPLTG